MLKQAPKHTIKPTGIKKLTQKTALKIPHVTKTCAPSETFNSTHEIV